MGRKVLLLLPILGKNDAQTQKCLQIFLILILCKYLIQFIGNLHILLLICGFLVLSIYTLSLSCPFQSRGISLRLAGFTQYSGVHKGPGDSMTSTATISWDMSFL